MANWIKGAIKHPGAVKNAAKREGISTHQEAEKLSKSPDKKKRSRGILALRFERHDI